MMEDEAIPKTHYPYWKLAAQAKQSKASTPYSPYKPTL
jgi:hypothetical protein